MSDQFIYDNYFETIAPIWKQFFDGKISLKDRDEQLQGYRVILFREQQRRRKVDVKQLLNQPIPLAEADEA